jgi:hypothetical protein
MHSKTAFATLATAAFAFAFASTPAIAAPSDDACALITAAQVSSIVGVTMGAGQHTTPTFVKTCTWTRSGGAANGVKIVTVSYEDAAAFAGTKQMTMQMQAAAAAQGAAGKAVFLPASGIGDDAFYANMGMATYMGLLVKKGGVSFKVAIYGAVSPEKAEAMEKSIALQALSKV